MKSFCGPAEVYGSLERRRNSLQLILVIIFVTLPWLRINDRPAFLIDFVRRQFILFGEVFYSHDAPLLFFVLFLTVLSIFILTALFGRLWCGWTCPQTVFINFVFNKVEKLIFGSYTKRLKEFAQPSTATHLKTIVLYSIFLLLSSVLAHSFVSYFLGSERVMSYIHEGPAAHFTPFIVVTVMTGVLFFNFTFFREKLCFYVCPYGRFQNALIDNNSLTVFYDKVRGEARGKMSPEATDRGDCIDCGRCVRACPTKIDIRNGFQMECIACGMCIDACDEIMTKVGKPSKLIRYETGNQKKITLHRFRIYLYGILFLVFSSAFTYVLLNRSDLNFNIARSHGDPFSVRIVEGKKVFINQFQVHLKNNTDRNLHINLNLADTDLEKGFKISTPATNLVLAAEKDLSLPAFVESNEANQAQDFRFVIEYSHDEANTLSKSELETKFIR